MYSALIFSAMKRLLSILFSVDERMVILDSYVSDSLSYIVAKRITHRVCNDGPSFSQYGCFHRTLQRVRLANRGRLLLRTPVLSHLGLAFVIMLRPFFPELVMSTDFLGFEHPSVLQFCSASCRVRNGCTVMSEIAVQSINSNIYIYLSKFLSYHLTS